ncbi:RNA polymerase sigma factor [Limnovirga soli]|jgi:RNA polymerase sigma-70 factor (ECF subfamily)|uniref:Sigma-70 family RNA polymerase sigma factor n=1 Tax=Limnovirga soli TaxID=2656915 RepID=A0A8J8FG23_9BACT|nr:sigma-70 family RNA polymerase sigma factor [Limnovirga soli]NNV57491.1 sigma-70 family RNA polymerase sigma factor [Limnovirga soli]
MPDTIKYTETELVLLLKERDQSAFGYLYDNYSGALFNIVLAIIPDRELASDVLQEVFVKIWRQVALYDATKGRLFTWMMNIARNASIDVLRSKSYNNSQQNRELTENVYANAGTTVTNTDKIGLRKVVHSLKDEYKILVELSYFEGYTQDEISKMLNIPLGTVKTRLRNALLQLRELVKN